MPRFDELTPGLTLPLGQHSVNEPALIAYARDFDPQPMHLDAASAQAQGVGGLISSGWQTAAITHAMAMRALLAPEDIIALPAAPRLKWAAPTRVGDVLTGQATVLRRRLSHSRPGMGLVDLAYTLTNQHNAVVLELEERVMLRTARKDLPDEGCIAPLPAEALPRSQTPAHLGPVQEMPVGLVIPAGHHTFEATQCRTFAQTCNLRPGPLDAAGSQVSGWQGSAQWLRQMVDLFHAREAAGEVLPQRGPGMGLADMVWLKPVKTGDTLAYYSQVLGARPSASKPGWGILTLRNYAYNQRDEAVLAFTCFWLWEARP
jgi:acyl dehydratase